MSARIEKLKAILGELSLDAMYVTHIPNIRYISGFSGSSAFLIITKDKDYFFTDFRYKEQSKEQVKGFEMFVDFAPSVKISEIIKSLGLKNIGFESNHLTVTQLDTLKKSFPSSAFTALGDRIERLTMVKTEDELEKIKNACSITDRVFQKLLEIIKPGIKEKDVSAEISYWHKKYGADKDSFDPIVASGWRGALPHGVASDKIINSGEMVTLDFGCIYDGFCSDLTRTISVGEPALEMKKIYDTVLRSQVMAIKACKEGASSKDIDKIARDHINESGYEGKFGHGLGHGLGIEVHEMPGVSQKMDMLLPANVVITIEPGIYVEGLGGVRIEDDIIIKTGGNEVINKAPKELIII
jgi:Xaa-Pro aminopeptidase